MKPCEAWQAAAPRSAGQTSDPGLLDQQETGSISRSHHVDASLNCGGHQSTMDRNVTPVGRAKGAVGQGLPMPRRVWGAAGKTVLQNHPVSSGCGRLCTCPPSAPLTAQTCFFPHWTQTSQHPLPTLGGDVAILDPCSLAPPPAVTKISLKHDYQSPEMCKDFAT